MLFKTESEHSNNKLDRFTDVDDIRLSTTVEDTLIEEKKQLNSPESINKKSDSPVTKVTETAEKSHQTEPEYDNGSYKTVNFGTASSNKFHQSPETFQKSK
jgi:hypothetical protein